MGLCLGVSCRPKKNNTLVIFKSTVCTSKIPVLSFLGHVSLKNPELPWTDECPRKCIQNLEGLEMGGSKVTVAGLQSLSVQEGWQTSGFARGKVPEKSRARIRDQLISSHWSTRKDFGV